MVGSERCIRDRPDIGAILALAPKISEAAAGHKQRHSRRRAMSTIVNLTLGHSPDPDDAFMHYALARGKIDTGPYRFEHVLQDIQTLNERATRGELDITAISAVSYTHLRAHETVLDLVCRLLLEKKNNANYHTRYQIRDKHRT